MGTTSTTATTLEPAASPAQMRAELPAIDADRLDRLIAALENHVPAAALPQRDSWSYEFSVYDIPPLEIGRVIQFKEIFGVGVVYKF